MSKTIEETVKEIIKEEFHLSEKAVKNLAAKTHFATDLGASSWDYQGVLMAVEDKFGLKITEEEAEKIMTFGDLVDYVKRQDKLKAEIYK